MLNVVGSGVQTEATTLQFRVQAGRTSSQVYLAYQYHQQVLLALPL